MQVYGRKFLYFVQIYGHIPAYIYMTISFYIFYISTQQNFGCKFYLFSLTHSPMMATWLAETCSCWYL